MSNELEQKVAELQGTGNYAWDGSQKLKISGEKSLENASNLVVQIKKAIKAVEENRVFFTKPLNDQIKSINDKFRAVAQPYKDAETMISGKIIDYRRKENARIAEEQRLERERQQAEFEKEQEKLRAEAKKLKGIEKEMAIAEIPKEFVPEVEVKQATMIKTDSGDLKTRKTWKATVYDENVLAREFLSVDMVKINKAVREGARVIAGVTIEQVESLY